jgi:hypothetical protein
MIVHGQMADHALAVHLVGNVSDVHVSPSLVAPS